MNHRLVWIDCEMTGLDIERDALIEIACLVTDGELNLLDEGIDLIIKPPAEALESMPEVVREMRTASGLLAELPGGIAVAEAAELVLGYVRGRVPEAGRVPLCGSACATERLPRSGRACRSSGTTGRRCSCRSQVRTRRPRGRSRLGTPQRIRRVRRVRRALRAREARDAGDRYTRLQPRDVPPGSARLAV